MHRNEKLRGRSGSFWPCYVHHRDLGAAHTEGASGHHRNSTRKGFGCQFPHLLPISCSTVVLEALPTPVQCPGSGTHSVGSWEDPCYCVRKANGGQAMTSKQKTTAHGELKPLLTCSPCGSCFLLQCVVLPDVYHVECRVWAP